MYSDLVHHLYHYGVVFSFCPDDEVIFLQHKKYLAITIIEIVNIVETDSSVDVIIYVYTSDNMFTLSCILYTSYLPN